MPNKVKLFTLLGNYPNTLPIKEGKVPSDLVEFEFADFKVANKGFKPLVREARFDVGELAIVTFLQAKAFNKPYVLLPALVVARSQHHTLAYNPERGALTLGGLAGKRVGIRAYSVTTGVWIVTGTSAAGNGSSVFRSGSWRKASPDLLPWSSIVPAAGATARFHSKASRRPVTGEIGSQWAETWPSATHSGSRGARSACDSQ